MTIEVLNENSIEEIMACPQQYIDTTQDVVLLRVIYSGEANNPTYLMIGQDENTAEYYLVLEDNDTTEDFYPTENQTLVQLYEELLTKIVRGGN